MKRIGLLLVLTLLVSGCATYQATYYKISGPGGYMKTACGGPNDTMVIEINKDLALSVSAVGRWNRVGGDNERAFERVAFGFYVAPGHRLQLQPPEFQLLPDGANEPVKVKIERIIFLFARLPDVKGPVSDPEIEPPVSGELRKIVLQSRVVGGKKLSNEQYGFDATAEFRGAPEHNVSWLQSSFQHFRYYGTSTEIPLTGSKAVTLFPPNLLFDGMPIKVPTFRMERVMESLTGPLLC
jgi:hypothetical protein